MGLEIKVKGLDKTAYSDAKYIDGVAHNLEGTHIILPDGTNVPQLTVPDRDPLKAAYSTERARANRKIKTCVAFATTNNTTDTKAENILLDSKTRGKPPPTTFHIPRCSPAAGVAVGIEPAREKVSRKAIQAIKLAGHIPGLTYSQLNNAITMVIGSYIGYYARETFEQKTTARPFKQPASKPSVTPVTPHDTHTSKYTPRQTKEGWAATTHTQ